MDAECCAPSFACLPLKEAAKCSGVVECVFLVGCVVGMQVLSGSFDPKEHGAASGMVRGIAHKLNDAIILHEINDQAQEKAALVHKQVRLWSCLSGNTCVLEHGAWS